VSHPLDSPALSALRGWQSDLAVQEGGAVRFRPGYAAFAAGTPADLARLPRPEGGLLMMEAVRPDLPPHQAWRERMGVQMTLEAAPPGGTDLDVLSLGEADAAEMKALARLTEPGPFYAHTWRLGPFIGVRREGRLIAMAGERMRPDGFAEISGVCTHPDHRGGGLAAGLIRLKAREILARGETPFLHSWADNAGALKLYESLGFRARAAIHVMILGDPDFFAPV